MFSHASVVFDAAHPVAISSPGSEQFTVCAWLLLLIAPEVPFAGAWKLVCLVQGATQQQVRVERSARRTDPIRTHWSARVNQIHSSAGSGIITAPPLFVPVSWYPS
jgi:hypothetical protein